MKCEATQVCLLQLPYLNLKTFSSSTGFFNIDYYM